MANETVKTPRLSRNLISEVGVGIAVIGLANLGFLIYLDATAHAPNPYMGILTWIVAPAILIFGITLFIFGMLLERRRRHKLAPGEITRYPTIDLNEQRTRVILIDPSDPLHGQVTLQSAQFINERGQVVAFGLDATVNRSVRYLLTPSYRPRRHQ